MKYYVYISEVKVEMLYAQIAKPLRERVAKELKIDLKALSTSFRENPIEATKLSKLDLVSRYIEKHEQIGTVDTPNSYFKGIMSLLWGPPEDSPMVYFGGETEHTILGLVGSRKHVIGKAGESGLMTIASSFTPEIPNLLQTIRQKLFDNTHEKDDRFDQSDAGLVAFTTKHLKGPHQKMEFLAKRLIESYSHDNKKRVVLGSPIYVALVE
jgi:hypothetical protein